MSKLINLQVFEAKNVICGTIVPENVKEYGNYGEDFWCGIGLDNAQRAFIIPTHIIIGIFDDGSTKCAGIPSLSILNDKINPENLDAFYSNLFRFDTIIHEVGLYEVKSFIRYYQDDDEPEEAAKEGVYGDLVKSGIKITEKAKNYLLG